MESASVDIIHFLGCSYEMLQNRNAMKDSKKLLRQKSKRSYHLELIFGFLRKHLMLLRHFLRVGLESHLNNMFAWNTVKSYSIP